MKKEIYIISNGKLYSDKGTISFIDEEGNKKVFPIRNISDIYCVGNISLTSGIIKRVLMNELNVHFLSKYGTYRGSLSYSSILEGKVIRNQVIYSLNMEKRVEIAKEILESLRSALISLLNHYKKKNYELDLEISNIKIINFDLKDIKLLMGHEAEMWRYFYSALRKVIKYFDFEKREYKPPKGEVNSMISFGNMILYAEVYNLIKEVGLLAEIGFLHESNEKRYTLALDIAEMFKPIFVFSTIIYLINSRKINQYDFKNERGYTYLNEEGKYTFLQELNKRINKTFFIKDLGREVSLRFLIKRELQKLKKLFLDNEKYYSYKRWYECM